MKKQILTLALLLSIVSIFAQAPQAFNYQAVVRNNQGAVIYNQIVSLRISILQGSPLGDAVYVETHQIATNQYGIANLQIGEGTAVTGNFSQIAWASTTHFVKTELDITGNEQYEFIGTSQLLSVPYALYAAEAGNAGNNNDTSSTNELQVLNLSNDTLYLSNGNQVYLGNYLDNTDNQTLNLTGTDLTISNGNTISLAGEVDLDSDPTNEIQTLHYTNDTISISQANQIILPHDADRDSINELQVLALVEDTLFLSSGNYVVFPHDADRDSTNEIELPTNPIHGDMIFYNEDSWEKLAMPYITNSKAKYEIRWDTINNQPHWIQTTYLMEGVESFEVGNDIYYVAPEEYSSIWRSNGDIPYVFGSDGYTNTKQIVIVQSNNSEEGAAYLCDTLNMMGYDDWFLPSTGELSTYLLKYPFTPNHNHKVFWSSNNYNIDSSQALTIRVRLDGTVYLLPMAKDDVNTVRCFRKEKRK